MSGRLAVRFNPTSSNEVLPRILPRFRTRHPDVSYKFEDLTTSEQEQALREGRVDVALFLAPSVKRREIRQEIFLREPLVVVLPEDHRLTSNNRIELRELNREVFVFLPSRWGTGYQARVLHACQEARFTPNVVQEVECVHTLVCLVAAGMGIAPCPKSFRRFQPPGAVFRELHDPEGLFHVEFGLSWREQDSSPLPAAFVDVAHEIEAVRRTPVRRSDRRAPRRR